MNHSRILQMGDLANLLTTPILVTLLLKKDGEETLVTMKHGRKRALAQVVEEGEKELGPQLQTILKVIDNQ